MAGGIMRYVRVANAEADRARDRAVLVLMRHGVTKATFDFDAAFALFLREKDAAGLLCKSLVRNRRYIYESLNEI
jgi:hypothetical protein